METATTWLAFVGAWLLVAGPIFQAVRELRERSKETDRIRAQDSGVELPQPVSHWWWLLPPVHILLRQRRWSTYRRRYFAALSAEDSRTVVDFLETASAWLYVAAGGFLLAIRETWALTEHEHWALGWFFVLAVAATAFCVLNIVARTRRADSMAKPGA